MGYDLHITRRKHWSDDAQPENTITFNEWLQYITTDPELELSNAYRVKIPGSDTESHSAPGFCEWNAHSAGHRPWFDYSNGCITTKNPDRETIEKMLLMASALHAQVQGDDGELYFKNADGEILHRHLPGNVAAIDVIQEPKKPWWKFW